MSAGLVACAGKSKGKDAPQAPSAQTVAPLSNALLGTGDGIVPVGDSLDRLLDSPEVTAAGSRLLDRLGSDPQLQPIYSAFAGNLLTQPALMRTMSMMALKDGASGDDALERATARVDAALDAPAFDEALDRSLDTLLDRPDVDAAFGRIAEAMLEQAGFSDRVAGLLLQWQPELEAAVGVPMDHEDFPARLRAHVEQPDRNRALTELLGSRLVEDPGIRQGLAALLDDEAFFGACAELVTSLFASPDFEANVAAVFVAMLEQADAAQIEQRLDRVLVNPAVEKAVVTWADRVLASEAFARFGQRLGMALDDPNLQAELFDVLVGRSSRSTV